MSFNDFTYEMNNYNILLWNFIDKKQFIGEYELTSLIGNITMMKGEPFIHTHITFSDIDYHVFGGHLFDARVTAAGEFIMLTEAKIITRQMNSSIGLPLWCLEESID